jgi:hypothetical protein
MESCIRSEAEIDHDKLQPGKQTTGLDSRIFKISKRQLYHRDNFNSYMFNHFNIMKEITKSHVLNIVYLVFGNISANVLQACRRHSTTQTCQPVWKTEPM